MNNRNKNTNRWIWLSFLALGAMLIRGCHKIDASSFSKSLQQFILLGMILIASACGSGNESGNNFNLGVSFPGEWRTVVLQNNGASDRTLTGISYRPDVWTLSSDSYYEVTVLTPPTGQTCTVSGGENGDGSGTISGANVTVTVTCVDTAPGTYLVGGMVSGLTGTGLVLQNSGGNDLSISADGVFAFSTAVVDESAYTVTVSTNPMGQTCTVINGFGTISGANITDVAVTCIANTFEIIRVSVASDGAEGNNSSQRSSMSSDGRYVAFNSSADNLVASDTNILSDIFVHDTQTDVTTQVSAPNLADQGTLGTQGDGISHALSLSADGISVAFGSSATNLVMGDTNSYQDIFVHNSQTGMTTRISVPNLADQGTLGLQGLWDSLTPSISSDGRYVAFASLANNLVTGDINSNVDIFVHDTQTGETTRVSVPNLTEQGTLGTEANGDSYAPSISADGRYVAFESDATNLFAATIRFSGDTNGYRDIFVHDIQTGYTSIVSLTRGFYPTNWNSSNASISADGRYIAFDSEATNLVSGDTNSSRDVFVHDTQDHTFLISAASDWTIGDNDSFTPSISSDGRFVTFSSSAENLVARDNNGNRDVFVRDTVTGTTARLSKASDGTEGNDDSLNPSISADGRYVAFGSNADNLVGDTNAVRDVFRVRNTFNFAPTVSSTTPAAGATDVSVGTRISAQFTEPMDPTTITNDSFIVNGGAVTGSVSYDTDSRTATFTPSANLDQSTLYSATLTNTIADLAGNSLTADEVWSFTTGAVVVSCTDPNSLSLHWPIDIGTSPALLALSPSEVQFAGVACLESPPNLAIRWTIEDSETDPRSSCSPCADPDFETAQDFSTTYPDGANISVEQGSGFNFGNWSVSVQLFDQDTGADFAGSEFFDLVVDPGAFQIIRGGNWQNLTLSLFGDMPGASLVDPVGSCAAGVAEWTLSFFGGAVVDTLCFNIDNLDPDSAFE